MDGGESLSIEETNKLRIAAGLKPLKIDSDEKPAENSAESNFEKHRQQQKKERQENELRQKIEKTRNRLELDRKLAGKGLADADAALDTKEWIKQSKKKQKILAKQRAKELEEMDIMYQQNSYTAKDLAGLRVAHDLEDLTEGKEQILTLKDANILDDAAEDELISVNILDQERTRKNLENKKKKAAYNVYEENEVGKSRNLLSQYDEDLNSSSFVISSGGITKLGKSKLKSADNNSQDDKVFVDLSKLKDVSEASDYQTIEEVSFIKKKRKKKNNKSSRSRLVEDDEDDAEPMHVDKPAPIVKQNLDNTNLVDDDEMQLAIAKARRAKAMSHIAYMQPEQVAEQLKNSQAIKMYTESTVEDEGRLVIDGTSEFVRGLQMDEESLTGGSDREEPEHDDKSRLQISIDRSIKVEEVQDSKQENALGLNSTEAMDTDEDKTETSATVEPLVAKGLAATLALLRQQGLSIKPSEEQVARERIQRERAKWIQEQKQRELEREAERRRVKQQNTAITNGSSKDKQAAAATAPRGASREQEIREAQEAFERFKDYKPDVEITYTDAFGRNMTRKEAWQDLSYKFHGKTPGKAKTEKLLKKIEEERKMERRLAEESVVGAMSTLATRQAQTGKAGLVLERGKRAVVPEFIGLAGDQKRRKNTGDD